MLGMEPKDCLLQAAVVHSPTPFHLHFRYIYLIMGRGHMSPKVCVKVTGQLVGVSSQLPCWSMGSNSGHGTWPQEPILDKPSPQLTLAF